MKNPPGYFPYSLATYRRHHREALRLLDVAADAYRSARRQALVVCADRRAKRTRGEFYGPGEGAAVLAREDALYVALDARHWYYEHRRRASRRAEAVQAKKAQAGRL